MFLSQSLHETDLEFERFTRTVFKNIEFCQWAEKGAIMIDLVAL